MFAIGAGCGRIHFEEHERSFDLGPDASPAVAATAHQTLILGIEGESRSHLVALDWDPDTGTATLAHPPIRLDALTGSSLRSVSIQGDSAFAGGGHAVATVDTDTWTATGAYSVESSIGGVHGSCALPGGTWVFGDSGPNPGNHVAEFELVGDSFAQIGDVYTTTIDSGSLSACVPVSDIELLLIEWSSYTDTDGDLVRLVSDGAQWRVEARMDTSAFEQAEHGGDHDTSIYSFALHPSGSVYVFPQRRFSQRLQSLLECPADFSSEADCRELGALPPDTTSTKNGPDAIQGAAVDGTRDAIFFATNQRVYRYDLTSDTWVMVFDFSAMTLKGDQVSQVRDLRVAH